MEKQRLKDLILQSFMETKIDNEAKLLSQKLIKEIDNFCQNLNEEQKEKWDKLENSFLDSNYHDLERLAEFILNMLITY